MGTCEMFSLGAELKNKIISLLKQKIGFFGGLQQKYIMINSEFVSNVQNELCRVWWVCYFIILCVYDA